MRMFSRHDSRHSLRGLGMVVKLGLVLGLCGYHTTMALAAAPIGQTIWLRANANNLFVWPIKILEQTYPLQPTAEQWMLQSSSK